MHLQTGRVIDFLNSPDAENSTSKVISLSYILRYLTLSNIYWVDFIVGIQISDQLTLKAL